MHKVFHSFQYLIGALGKCKGGKEVPGRGSPCFLASSVWSGVLTVFYGVAFQRVLLKVNLAHWRHAADNKKLVDFV
jgi:hypothetical protein